MPRRNVLDIIRQKKTDNSFLNELHHILGEKDAGPVKCRVGFKVNSLWDVDCRTLTFKCDVQLFYQWQDPRLVGKTNADVDWEDKELFDPDLILGNASDIETYFTEKKIEKSDVGLVHQSKYYRGIFHLSEVCMINFPFDYQDLAIVIRPQKMPANKVELVAWGECAAIDHVPKHEWDCVGLRTETYATHPKLSTTHKVYCVFHVIVMVKRFAGWFMWNVAFFLIIIIIASSVVFFLPYGARANESRDRERERPREAERGRERPREAEQCGELRVWQIRMAPHRRVECVWVCLVGTSTCPVQLRG